MLWSVVLSLQSSCRTRFITASDTAVSDQADGCGSVCACRGEGEERWAGEWVLTAAGLGVRHSLALELCAVCGREEF